MSGDTAARHAQEIAREEQLSEAARGHAVELLKIAAELRWGDDSTMGCVHGFLVQAARDLGIELYRYLPPSALSATAREIFQTLCGSCNSRKGAK